MQSLSFIARRTSLNSRVSASFSGIAGRSGWNGSMPVTASDAASSFAPRTAARESASSRRARAAVGLDLDQHRGDFQQRIGVRIEAAALDVDHDGQEAAEAARHGQSLAHAALLRDEAPGERLARAERHELVAGRRDRPPAASTASRSSVMRSRIARQAVEIRAALGRERLQAIERAGLLERFRVQLDGGVRRENAGAAARRLLRVPRVRRAVGAEEEARIVARRRFDQRPAIVLALEHRQAVVVRPDAALEDRIAIQQQVLRRDRRADAAARALDELHGFARRDVLEHDAQAREALDDPARGRDR